LLSGLRSVRCLKVLVCIVLLPILFAYTTYHAEWWNSQLPVLHDLFYQISQCMLVHLVTNSPTISPHAFSVLGTLDIYHHSTSHMPTYDASLTAKEYSKYTFHSIAMFVFYILPKTASPLTVRIFERRTYQLLVSYFHKKTHLRSNNSLFRTCRVSVYYWIIIKTRWVFRPFMIWTVHVLNSFKIHFARVKSLRMI
jgi:hypothetical protein